MVPENHNDQQPEQQQQPQQQQAPQTPESGVRISTRISIPRERYSPSLYYVLMTDFGEPECYEEAVQNKWVYRLKEEDGGRKRYKARLLVKGFAQKKGIDFDVIFPPIVKMTSIRTILSLVAAEDLHLEQLDVNMSLLHGDFEEEIYMQQPQVYEVKGKEKLLCRFKKILYGLK
eukprot:PITA_03148